MTRSIRETGKKRKRLTSIKGLIPKAKKYLPNSQNRPITSVFSNYEVANEGWKTKSDNGLFEGKGEEG